MWKNLSPIIYRKRLIIEGTLPAILNRKQIDAYLKKLSKLLKMKLVMGPLTRDNPRYGLSSYIYWEESGTHLYYWHKPFPFVSVDIYTCKRFRTNIAVDFTRKYFSITKMVWKEIAF